MQCVITQGYKQIANASGTHSGIDESCGYRSLVYGLKKMKVYKVLDDAHPANDGSGYWGVFGICDEGNGVYSEWQSGHLDEIHVAPGNTTNPWTVLGLEGNHGEVYSNGVRITLEMQRAGDTRGHHRHWNKKFIEKVHLSEREDKPGTYLTAWGKEFNFPYKDDGGFYYRILNYDNGLRGSVDPSKDMIDGYTAVANYFIEINKPQPQPEPEIPTPTPEPDPIEPPPFSDPDKPPTKKEIGIFMAIVAGLKLVVEAMLRKFKK